MFESTVETDLMQMPDLPILLGRLQSKLDEEKARRAEFRTWLTEDAKAEFINGAIVMHSPAADDHNEATGQLYRVASLYADVKNLGKVRVEKALVGLTRNDYEPDVAFWKTEKSDQFFPGMNVYPAPDLVVEVLSPGKENTKRDRDTKFDDYAAHGIPEYWIVDPKKQSVEQYLLSGENPDRYELLKKATMDDSIQSVLLVGFIIPVRAIFDAGANAEAMRSLLQ